MINSYKHSEYIKQDLVKNDSAIKQDSKDHLLRSLLSLLRSAPVAERSQKAVLLAQLNQKITWIKRVLLDEDFRDLLIDLLEYEGFSQIPVSTFHKWDTTSSRVGSHRKIYLLFFKN